MNDLKKELLEIRERSTIDLQKLADIEKILKHEEIVLGQVTDKINSELGRLIDPELFMKFWKKPYTISDIKNDSVIINVPKFVKNFQVGWLHDQDENFYKYRLDQYSQWLGDVPENLQNLLNLHEEVKATVDGNQVFFDPSEKKKVKDYLGSYIKTVSDSEARIIEGHEFDVLVRLIEAKRLPFKKRPVISSDMRSAKSGINLRSYQKDAYKIFLQTGAIGLFHPTGSGKSFTAMYAMDVLKGKKLIVVPRKILLEQWSYYIDTFIPHLKNEITISTYQGFRDYDAEYILTIYDECQSLPSDTFSRLATINTKYRMGLSASPHREDKREKYIYALTGFPVGLNWKEFMEKEKRNYHPVIVHISKHEYTKIEIIKEILDWKKKTLIFCDSIDKGKEIAKVFNIPFVYGKSENRLETIQNNKIVVVSRAVDLGTSIKDLERVIEADFLFGSRQQELQRTGRLMHSEMDAKVHDIIMTEKEELSYGKRLWALTEKGFTIEHVYH